MTDTARNPDNFCYRHPDRQSFIICQRCGRTICAECQTQAAVGVHCPECVREARESAPRTSGRATRTRIKRSMRPSSGVPVVTYTLIALNVIVFALDFVTGGSLYPWLAYRGDFTETQPWRMLTSTFMHASVLHLLFNMFSLFIFGRLIEQAIGRVRYAVLYLLAAFGGSVAVLLLAPTSAVVGASGAIFGLLGAFFIIQRRLGGNNTQLLVLIGLNVAFGFIVPNVAWQAHLGGLVVGAAVAAVYMATRHRSKRAVQVASVIAIGVALVVVTIAAVTI